MKKLAYILLIAAVTFWGLSLVWVQKLLSADIPIATYNFARIGLAAVIMLVFCGASGRLQRIEKKDLKWFLLLGFVHPFLYTVFENYGLKTTESITLCALIGAMIPIFSLFVSAAIFKTKITWQGLVGAVLVIPGVYLLSVGQIGARYWWGAGLLVLSVCCSIIYNIVVLKVSDRYNTWTTVTSQFTVGAVCFGVMMVCSGGGAGEAAGAGAAGCGTAGAALSGGWDFAGVQALKVFTQWEYLYPLLCLAVLCSVAAFVFFVIAIKELGMAKTTMFNPITPIVSALAAYFLCLEDFSVEKAIGVVVILFAVILAQR